MLLFISSPSKHMRIQMTPDEESWLITPLPFISQLCPFDKILGRGYWSGGRKNKNTYLFGSRVNKYLFTLPPSG